MKQHNHKKSAFTLIELLVVIAIIAILAAILFPVFARARENARRTSCQSNMKNLGLAIIMYTQDYDEFYPLKGNRLAPSPSPYISWRGHIQPYVKSEQLLICPSNPRNESAINDPGPYTGLRRSYALTNGEGGGTSEFGILRTSSSAVPVHMADVVNPTETIMGVESTSGLNEWSPRNNSIAANLFCGHLGTANFLFIDGHVKALRPTRTVDMYNRNGAINVTAVRDGIRANLATAEATFN